MPHGIDESTGRPAMAYVGKKPWHGLGKQLAAGQPIEKWLKAVELNWELNRLPVQYLAKGKHRTMEDRYVLARSDTYEALSIVSGDYKMVQPREILEFYRDLMDSYGYALETAGALDGGRKVWALAKTGRTADVAGFKKDQLAAYVLLATSCDKTLATTAAFTSIRVVCKNTLTFATEDIRREGRPQVKVPHNILFDAPKVKEDLGLLEPAWTSFVEKVAHMAQRPITKELARDFFTSLFVQKNGRPISRSAEQECQTISALFESAPGQDLPTANGTLWGAVNAVSYYADHVRSGNGERLDAAWFGSGYALKERAWTGARTFLA